MKILFFTIYPEVGASSRYRVFQFLPFFRRLGHECTVIPYYTEAAFEMSMKVAPKRRFYLYGHNFVRWFRRRLFPFKAADYDIIFLQKGAATGVARLRGE